MAHSTDPRSPAPNYPTFRSLADAARNDPELYRSLFGPPDDEEAALAEAPELPPPTEAEINAMALADGEADPFATVPPVEAQPEPRCVDCLGPGPLEGGSCARCNERLSAWRGRHLRHGKKSPRYGRC